MQVKLEITQTAARNKVLSSKWANDDTPIQKVQSNSN